MSTGNGIPLDKAELLSVLLEGVLYGFSLLMFGGTVCVLCSQRSARQVNRRMLAVACLLFLFSTVHLVIDIIRIMQGLILFRDTYPGGPVGFFSDVSQWTFGCRQYVYIAQTLIGDSVILYRCYAVWQSKRVMILPALLWCAVVVTGIGTAYTARHVMTQSLDVFGGSLSRWITSFYVSTLTTNLLTTLLLAYRIWSVDRSANRLCVYRTSRLRPILHITVDAGLIYSVTLVAALICFVNRCNGQYVILDTVMPIIAITFYMVIIRVGLAHRGARNQSTKSGTVQVQITTLTERMVEQGQHSPKRSMAPLGGENRRRSEITFDGVRDSEGHGLWVEQVEQELVKK